MRRLTAWIGGIASGVVAYRFWRRHRSAGAEAGPQAAAEADARAEELRAKLAESRYAEPVVEEPAAPEHTVEEPHGEPPEPTADEPPSEPTEPESVDERRRRVHEEGRATIEEMHSE